MWMLGMPTPLVFGVMVALLNFLPYLGPALACIILTAVAIVTFDTPQAMILPPVVYLVLHAIEGQLVVPFVLGRRMAVNPVILFLWVLIFTWVWGAPGTVIAVPMLVAVRISAERIALLGPLASLLARDSAQTIPIPGEEAAVSSHQEHLDSSRPESEGKSEQRSCNLEPAAYEPKPGYQG